MIRDGTINSRTSPNTKSMTTTASGAATNQNTASPMAPTRSPIPAAPARMAMTAMVSTASSSDEETAHPSISPTTTHPRDLFRARSESPVTEAIEPATCKPSSHRRDDPGMPFPSRNGRPFAPRCKPIGVLDVEPTTGPHIVVAEHTPRLHGPQPTLAGSIGTGSHGRGRHAISTAAAFSSPSALTLSSRMTNFWTLPVTVMGKASTNLT
jgi:hypothetical protein